MATVLLYNIKNPDKRMTIKRCLFRLGLPCRDVEPAAFGHPLGYLLGLEGYAPGESGESFEGEMLVMHNLNRLQFGALLDALRTSGAPVALKAVVTETNASWSSARLYQELEKEHRAMQSAGKRKKHT